jgi:ATP-dependent exoDNAse (exonuclease V) beta subunit
LITEDFSEELMIRTVCQEWKRQGVNAADLGTKLHKYIEDKYNEIIEGRVGNKVGEDMKTRGPEYDYADQFMEKKHREGFVPFRTEWMLYDERLKISGTIDMIYYHPVTQTYHMVDWKRSKKISKYGYRRYGLGPCSNLQDCNYSHYSLQLNIYKWLLETHYSIQIQSMDIVVLHPSNKTFLEFEIETFAFTRTLLGLPPIDETDAPPRQLYTWI